MSNPIRNLAASSAVALLLAACSGGDATGPAGAELLLNADIAQLAVQGAAADIEVMGGPAGRGMPGFGLFGVALNGPGGPFAARDLGCRQLTTPVLTITRTCTFTDASGATQTSYDPTTTAAARIETTIAGTMAHQNWTAALERSSDVTVSGLAGAETQRTWNGSGAESVSRSRHTEGQGSRAYMADITVTITNVVVPVPSGPDTWPLSGSITRTMAGEITEGPRAGETIARTATITFNGTSTVTMTINGESFEVDLAARRAERRR
ncbi:MAG: hypothetical protein SGI84_01545 [Gemmatimonadota bacterium]|nr:hypothetical protein [Gemmatimonadota bacterium]